MPFVKLDCGILDSSLWVDRAGRDCFITGMLMAEPFELTESTPQLEVRNLKETGFVVPPGWYGLVRAAGIGIVRRAGYLPDEIEAGMQALERLGSPDNESRSEEYGGRRLVRVNDGYLVLNYMRFRDFDYGAKDRMRRLRERRKTEGASPVRRNKRNVRRNVTHSREQRAESIPMESSGSSNGIQNPKSSSDSNIVRPASDEHQQKPKLDPVEAIYQAYPRHEGKDAAKRAIEKAVKKLIREETCATVDEAHRYLWKKAAEYARSPAGQRGTYTPMPATWFNRGSYADDPAEWQKEESSGKRSVVTANRKAARAIFERTQRSTASDHQGDDGIVGLLGASSERGDVRGLFEIPQRPEPVAAGNGVRSGGEGVRVLASPGGTPAPGGHRNSGPVF